MRAVAAARRLWCGSGGDGGWARPRNSSGSPWYLNECDYECLYELAALPAEATPAVVPPRLAMQIHHELDPCCWAGKGRHVELRAYEASVNARLRAVSGHGHFAVSVTDYNKHEFCALDKAVISAALAHRSGSTRNEPPPNLPCDILHTPRAPCPVQLRSSKRLRTRTRTTTSDQ